jgi:copper chaperone CopZ
MMKKVQLRVQKEFCSECSLAIMRFMKNMEGVESVVAENGEVVITYDDSRVDGETVEKIARDTVRTLGYKMEEETEADSS